MGECAQWCGEDIPQYVLKYWLSVTGYKRCKSKEETFGKLQTRVYSEELERYQGKETISESIIC